MAIRLCYRCDAKRAIGQHCNKELNVMLIVEDEGETNGEDSESPISLTTEVTIEVFHNSVSHWYF